MASWECVTTFGFPAEILKEKSEHVSAEKVYKTLSFLLTAKRFFLNIAEIFRSHLLQAAEAATSSSDSQLSVHEKLAIAEYAWVSQKFPATDLLVSWGS